MNHDGTEEEIPHCPLRLVDEATAEAIELEAAWRRGVTPVAGGVLDQSEGALMAIEIVGAERSRWTAQMRARGKEVVSD